MLALTTTAVKPFSGMHFAREQNVHIYQALVALNRIVNGVSCEASFFIGKFRKADLIGSNLKKRLRFLKKRL